MIRSPLLSALTIRHLQVFLAAARGPTFRAAAEELGISKATVSEHISAIEQALGVGLFERSSGRRAQLTSAGAVVRAEWQAAADAFERGRRQVRALTHPSPSVVRLGCLDLFGGWVPSLYRALQRDCPDVVLEVRTAARDELTAALVEGQLDLTVLLEDGEDRVSAGHQPLSLGMDLVLVAKADHPSAGAAPVPLAGLAGERFILPPRGSIQRRLLERRATALGVDLQAHWEIGTSDARIQAARSGLGIASAWRTADVDWLDDGDLAVLPVEGFPVEARWFVSKGAGADRPAVARVVACLFSHCREWSEGRPAPNASL